MLFYLDKNYKKRFGVYIKRELEDKIKHYLSFKEILAIIGPRQAGKTTLVNKCLDDLKNKKINRISFEDLDILKKFETDIKAFIIEFIEGYDIVFIDEVQYAKSSGQSLKYIYDSIKNVKIIISGSSATELSLHSIKYLVGRIFVFELYTLSFNEYLQFKNKKLFKIYRKGYLSGIYLEELNKVLKEYLTFGGYPRIALMNKKEDKKIILKNIYNTYLLKEIKEILEYKETHLLDTLIKNLAVQMGGMVNYNDLSAKTGIPYKKLKEQLAILEKTFICSFALNYHTNKKIELSKSPKIYFFDIGLRNFIIDNFSINMEGSILENFVYIQMIIQGIKPKFWRTRTKAEVDFILEKQGEVIPIEIKTRISKNSVSKAMRSFIERYKPQQAFFVSLDYTDKRDVNTTKIRFITFMDFLLYLQTFDN